MSDETRKADPIPDAGATQTSDTGVTLVRPEHQQARLAAEAGGVAVPGFVLEGTLGRGGMGVVYKATQTGLNRVVALKMLIAGQYADPALRTRFLLEAESVAALEHPHIIRVFAFGEYGGRPYLAMEFVPAGTLAECIKKNGPMLADEATELVAKLAEAVAHAHSRGVVHRDIKPLNVLLTAEGEPRLADFGLAKVGRIDQNLSVTGQVLGTPAYMAPEQAAGKVHEVGTAADVYALGAVLYDVLTGRPPFTGDSAAVTLQKVLTEEPQRPRKHNPSIPHDLETICLKCLEKDPAKRYPTAQALADDLRRYVRGEPITARPLGTASRAVRWARRNPAVAGLLAVVVVVTFGLVGSLYGQYRQAAAAADTEREAKETAERARHHSDVARGNAERAAEEAKRREEAEVAAARAREEAARVKAQAALADTLIAQLDGLFRATDPVGVFFGDTVPFLGTATGGEGQAPVLRSFLQNAAASFRASLTEPSAALVRAKLLASIGNGMKTLGMLTEAKGVLAEALALRRANLPEAHSDVLRSELDLGRLEADIGELTEAIERFRRVLALQKKACADEAALLTTRLYEGTAMSVLGLDEAEPVLKEVVRARERLLGKNHKDTLFAKLALIAHYLERQQAAQVSPLVPSLQEGIEAQLDEKIRNVFKLTMQFQASLAFANGMKSLDLPSMLRPQVERIKNAITQLTKLLPENHLLLSVMRFELAKLLLRLGEGREADELFARVTTDAKNTVGLAHPKVLNLLAAYSKRLVETKRVPEARALYQQVELANRERFGPENPWLTVVLLQRAAFERRQGGNGEALKSAQGALALLNQGKFLPTRGNLIDLFEAANTLGKGTGDLRNASRELFLALRPLVAKVYGQTSAEMVITLTREGQLLYDSGDRTGAAAIFEQATGMLPSVQKLAPVERVDLLFCCGQLELDRGRFAEAERHFRDLRDAAAKVAGYPAANRKIDALLLAQSLAAQRRYEEAVPLFEEARKLEPGSTAEKDLAFADMHVAVAQLAAGERDAYLRSLDRMWKQYGKSKDGNTLVRLAWAGGLSATPGGWKPAEFDALLAASSFRTFKDFPWGFRGVALVRLRAGNFAGAEEALGKVGKTVHPADHVIRGLVAVARNDAAAARTYLGKAEALIAAEKPSEKNPFAYTGRSWNQDTEVAILLAELRAALMTPLAPPPRVKG